jgi:hypothetical protein
MGVDLLWTFVGCCIQPPSMRNDYVDVSGARLPRRSFSAELDSEEINTQIRGILVHWADQDPGPSPVSLRESVVSPWVSLLELTFVCFCQFLLR